MGRRATNGPTEAELEILSVLWETGPAAVRRVHEAIDRKRPTGKTTTLKLMQIMTDKGLLVRDEDARPQIYRPAMSKTKAQRKLLRTLLDRAFDGSAGQMVLRALGTKKTSPAELAQIRKLLEKLEGDQE
jgi:BlaI family penicillinase repressor